MFHEIPEPPGKKSNEPISEIFDASKTPFTDSYQRRSAIISFIMQNVHLIFAALSSTIDRGDGGMRDDNDITMDSLQS